MSSNLYLGIDLGGTNIQCGLVDVTKPVHKVGVTHRGDTKTKADKFPGNDGAPEVVKRIAGLAQEVLDDAKLTLDDIAGVGIGAPGVIDHEAGVVSVAVNLGWADYPLAKALSKELDGLPVVLDNDVNVGAWGEYKAGAARKFDSLLAVFIGTGIGGGLIFDGKLFHGHHHTAGEIGHVVYNPHGITGRKTVENLASRTNLAQHLAQLIHTGHRSCVPELVNGDLSKIRSKVIAKAAAQEDAVTLQVIEHGMHALGIAIANTVTMLSLPCVVVGGGLTEAIGDPLLKSIRRSYEKHVFPDALRDVRIVPSELNDDAGVVGAALLAQSRLQVG
ncbi:MAG: ROK family protein [Planctomycetota bacterium]